MDSENNLSGSASDEMKGFMDKDPLHLLPPISPVSGDESLKFFQEIDSFEEFRAKTAWEENATLFEHYQEDDELELQEEETPKEPASDEVEYEDDFEEGPCRINSCGGL